MLEIYPSRQNPSETISKGEEVKDLGVCCWHSLRFGEIHFYTRKGAKSFLLDDLLILVGLDKNNKTSSAYKVILWRSWPITILQTAGSHLFVSVNDFIARLNNSGDRGQPCWLPLLRVFRPNHISCNSCHRAIKKNLKGVNEIMT